MTKNDFLLKLKENGVDTDLISFEDNSKDGYCMRKNYYRWEVFTRERGKEYDVIGFPSESDALLYLLDRLLKIYIK